MFSFDLTALTDTAGQLFTALMPVVGIVGGLTLGVGLVGFVIKHVKSIAGAGGK